jgi:hypothetical protein
LVRQTPPVLPSAPGHIVANAPEAGDYKLVYQLPIDNTAFNPGRYTVDNSKLVPDGSYDRIAYYVELESATFGSQYVWVSSDAFETDASYIGVPNTAEHMKQMQITNMNVVSNVAGDVTGQTGNVEFWSTNYSGTETDLIPGGTGDFDFDDTPGATGNYGSMQIHNFGDGETLFAYNGWNDARVSDLGMGNQPTGNPDWTFAYAGLGGADDYSVKNLYVLIHPIPEPMSLGLLGMGGLAVVLRRKRER